MYCELILEVPNSTLKLRPGCKVKLGRFDSKVWELCHGWFSFGGNRPFCGWHLKTDNGLTVKPLQLPDLDDIYMIEN